MKNRSIFMTCAAISLAATSPIKAGEITLKTPAQPLTITLQQAIQERHSVREFGPEAISQEDVAQILWAAQGLTDGGHRAAPSAGALYPLEIYLVAGRVKDLSAGVYHYRPSTLAECKLTQVQEGEVLKKLSDAALGQGCVRDCAACLVITAEVSRTSVKYGNRAERYVAMECGHVAQNVLLTATGLHLGGVPAGAFDDAAVKKLLGIPEAPYYLLPIGVPKP
jgi:SagB-type dehydrogenase family enzyme